MGRCKNQYTVVDCLKSGTWKVWRFEKGLGEKEEGRMFKGGRGWYPKAHYGCFWVVFWQELGKMSILFKILISDDMQDDSSDMLGLLLKY